MDWRAFNLATSERPEQIDGQVTTPGFYTMMGVPFELGRDFLQEEGQPGREHVVILAHNLWVRMGARRDIVGQPIRMNGEPYTVVGIMAPGPTDRLRTKLVVPLAFKPEQINHTFHWLLVMGRLKPGMTLAMAQADMDLVAAHIAQDHPDTNKTWRTRVDDLKNDFLPEETRSRVLVADGSGRFRAVDCLRERGQSPACKKHGAPQGSGSAGVSRRTRGQLFAQFLTESLALALVGGVAGIGLGIALIRVLMAIMPPFTLPSEAEVGLSVPVLLFTLAATLLAAVLFGCAPALQASGVDPNEALKKVGALEPARAVTVCAGPWW